MTQTTTRKYVTGTGWSACVQAEHILIHVAPEGDYLPTAINCLLTPARQPFYVIEHVGVDELTGWDVYECINTAWIPDCDDYEVAASWVTIR